MKLKNIIKHIDGFGYASLNDANDNVLWTGAILNLQVAADNAKNRIEYLKECNYDEAYEDIKQVISGRKYLNWKLLSDEEAEAINISFLLIHMELLFLN